MGENIKAKYLSYECIWTILWIYTVVMLNNLMLFLLLTLLQNHVLLNICMTDNFKKSFAWNLY